MLKELNIRGWIYSTNHKVIGTMYFVLGAIGGVLGIAMSILIRIELSYPGNQIFCSNKASSMRKKKNDNKRY